MPRTTDNHVRFDFRAAREAVGLSQYAAADLLHTNQPNIARWEANGQMPPIYREYWSLYWSTHKPKRGPRAPDERRGGRPAKKKPRRLRAKDVKSNDAGEEIEAEDSDE